jgi:hypothetical protein
MQKSKSASQAGEVVTPVLEIAYALGRYYRTATDWVKPTIDQVIDPIAIVVGANMVLSIAVFYAGTEIIQPFFIGISDGQPYSFIERHTWIKFIFKFVMYCYIYGFTNLVVILPTAKRLFKRRSVPSWKNHLKTWAILFIGLFAWTSGGVKQDYNRIKWRVLKADGFFDTIGAVFDPNNFKTIDSYMSGAKTSRMARSTWEVFGYNSNKAVALEIEQECRRIRQRHITTPADISKDAAPLIKRGLIDNPAQLIYITRVIYFEGAFDAKARSLADIKEGLTGIASVIYNRYIFDTANEKAGRRRAFSGEGANLYDIVFHRAPNKYGSITWQFSAIPKNTSYFNGKRPLSLASGKINPDRALLCYEILMEVLTEKRSDNTRAALFYQNPLCVDRHNRDWKSRGLDDVAKINSHVFFRPNYLPENWRRQIET